MSAVPAENQPVPAYKVTSDPAVFKVLDNGTVLYKTYQQAERAAQTLKSSRPAEGEAKKLSQVKYGQSYQARDGQVMPYTLGSLIEFQVTGLIVVMVVLTGLSLICAAVGRMIKGLEGVPVALPPPAAAPVTLPTTADSGIHPGLTDQQLVVLLTAAASEALGGPVRIGRFRPMTAKDWNWAAQGRSVLQSHQLK